MTPNEQYRNLARHLDELQKAHSKVYSQFGESLKQEQLNRLKSIEPFAKDLERLNNISRLMPNIDHLLNSPALEAARAANLAISRLSISPQLELLSKEFERMSEHWKSHLVPIALANESLIASFSGIQSQVARISEISILAERSLSTIDFNTIGQFARIEKQVQDSLRITHFSFSESYSNLFHSIEASRLSVLSIAPVVSTLSPIEFYFGNRFIESISTEEIEVSEEDETLSIDLQKETKDDIELHLSRLNNSLIKMWQGGTQALNSNNPDAIRHYSISLRELLTHIIHRLAPDQEIKAWTNTPELFHEGKPTRKARLLYICRGINHEPFSQFLKKDIDSTLACINLFQEGTHAISSDLSATQLGLLRIRVESSIRFLIRTHFDTNAN